VNGETLAPVTKPTTELNVFQKRRHLGSCRGDGTDASKRMISAISKQQVKKQKRVGENTSKGKTEQVPKPSAADPSAATERLDAALVAGRRLPGDALECKLVEVRHTGTSKGHGVFALSDIPENTWLGDYVGEVLTQEEYEERYPLGNASYVLSANESYSIDAADPAKSSYVRYMNHHASGIGANAFFVVARIRGQREKEVKFYTGRLVAAGEELCYDHGNV
jgi:hypothetical protein